MDIFKKIFDFLKKIWDVLKKILVIVLVVLAIYFTMGGSLVLFSGGITIFGVAFSAVTLSGGLAAAIMVGAAFLIDPEFTADIAEDVAEGIGAIAGSVTTGLLTSITSSPIGMLALGLGAYFLFFKSDGNSGNTEMPADDLIFLEDEDEVEDYVWSESDVMSDDDQSSVSFGAPASERYDWTGVKV